MSHIGGPETVIRKTSSGSPLPPSLGTGLSQITLLRSPTEEGFFVQNWLTLIQLPLAKSVSGTLARPVARCAATPET